jgi:hypothetical protein
VCATHARRTDAPVVAWDLRGSHVGNSPRRIAPPVFRLRLALARSKGLGQPAPARRDAAQEPVDRSLPSNDGNGSSSADIALDCRVHAARGCAQREAMGLHAASGASVEGASAPRRDAASPLRQLEKCAAGAPDRGGAVSPRSSETAVCPTDWAPACGLPKPERQAAGHRRKRIFAGVGRGVPDALWRGGVQIEAQRRRWGLVASDPRSESCGSFSPALAAAGKSIKSTFRLKPEATRASARHRRAALAAAESPRIARVFQLTSLR